MGDTFIPPPLQARIVPPLAQPYANINRRIIYTTPSAFADTAGMLINSGFLQLATPDATRP